MGCPVCKNSQIQNLFTIDAWIQNQFRRANAKHQAKAAFLKATQDINLQTVQQCTTCQFTFAYPRPSQQALNAYYQNYATTDKNEKRIFRRLPRYRRKVLKLIKSQRSPSATFLDIGCNIGTTVEAARLEGLEATGLDIDNRAINRAKKAFPSSTFIHGTLEQLTQQGRKFDIIHVKEVIEHIDKIHAFTAHLNKLLSERGILFMTTPNVSSVLTPRRIINWKHCQYPDHISLFSKRALEILLHEHGFKAINFHPHIGTKMVLTAQREYNI